jgi:hypothetical protein
MQNLKKKLLSKNYAPSWRVFQGENDEKFQSKISIRRRDGNGHTPGAQCLRRNYRGVPVFWCASARHRRMASAMKKNPENEILKQMALDFELRC